MNAIVTKENLATMISEADDVKRVHIVGRALVALFNRQTQAEQAVNATNNHNGIGFAGCDARSGSLTAKSYIKNRTLLKWQVEKWTALQKNGLPRICKYAGQLNEIALEKRRKELGGRLAQLRQEYGINVDCDDVRILEPIVKEMRALEQQLGVEPYVIAGAVV